MYNTLNYTEQGGAVTHIGGSLVIEQGATVTGLAANPLTAASASTLGGVKVGDGLAVTADGVLSLNLTPATTQADSTATTVATLKDDFNALLAKLKAAGLMAST